MKRAKKGGFSLVEVIVAIAVLGLVTAPVCAGLVMAFRINAKADQLMQEQLAASTKVEELMASGCDGSGSINSNVNGLAVTVNVGSAENDGDAYPVTVTCGDVEITTFIRPATEEGDGT